MKALAFRIKGFFGGKDRSFDSVATNEANDEPPIVRVHSKTEANATVHNTPAGRFSREAPQPSKVAVLLYYLSCVFCMIGTIMTIRSFFLTNVSGNAKSKWVGFCLLEGLLTLLW